MKRLRIWGLVLTGTLAGYAAGVHTSRADAEPATPTTWSALARFAEVYAAVQQDYVDPVDEDELVEASIRGLVGTLDEHSRYLSADELRRMQNDTSGEYVGVGISIDVQDGVVRIARVLEGGPALDAGLREEDLIRSIDGESTAGLGADDVSARLRGERGVPVLLGIERIDETGEVVTLEVNVTRDVVHVQAVTEALLAPGYGLVTIASFQDQVSEDLRAAIDRLQDQSGGELRGLVLDLRNNPGGLLAQAINVADAFMNEGVIVSTAGRDPAEGDSWSASRSATRYSGPLVVLMNGGSASASEVVAGALQDSGRALVVGTQSYGKGSVQNIINLEQGGGLKLTISRYYTPSGRSIHGTGITPDLVIEADGTWIPTVAPANAADGSAAAWSPLETDDPAALAITDLQLRAALIHLQGMP